ncbi:MAG: DUF167 domain-containing protein [Bdellovibrionota bacterium]
MPWLQAAPRGVLIRLQIQPKASRSEVVGAHGERLKIRIQAPPRDGEANDELLRFLKKRLGVPVELVRGASSRAKDVLCVGASAEQVRALLEAAD